MQDCLAALDAESPRTSGLCLEGDGAVEGRFEAVDDPLLGGVVGGPAGGEVEVGELADGHDLEGVLEEGDVVEPDDPPLVLDAGEGDQEAAEEDERHQQRHHDGRRQVHRREQRADADAQHDADGAHHHADGRVEEEGGGGGHQAGHPVQDGAEDEAEHDLEEHHNGDLGEIIRGGAVYPIGVFS